MPATYDECLADYYGHNWQETQRRIEARYGRPLPADFRETHRTRARARYMEGFDAVPGVADFLGALGATPRAIASSSRAEYIGWALGLFGLGHHFGEHVYRSEEHTSELQSLMRISYAVFCLKKKKTHK